jgi:hypothetical protein
LDSLDLPEADVVEDDSMWGYSISMTPDQWMIVSQALLKIRHDAGDGPSMTDGRALELMAADYLAGP